MLLAYLCLIHCFQVAFGQQPSSRQFPGREMDSFLQGYAFRAFVRPRTGIVYDGAVPSDLTGIRVAALRLRSGSLRRKGFIGYKEFEIPAGVVEKPYVQRLVLVYHNLGNWSSLYYPLPGYTFLAPVLGLLAYAASDLSAADLPELDIRALGHPISVEFPAIGSGLTHTAMCVYFGLDGTVMFDRLINNTCFANNQGHFSVVVPSVLAPAPPPAASNGGGRGGNEGGGGPEGGEDNGKRARIIVGSVVGGALLLTVLVLVLGYVGKISRRKNIQRMEEAADLGVPLPTTGVGSTKAPVAMETRTRPVLENEFLP